MVRSWQELGDLVGGQEMVIERVSLPGKGLAIEGRFEPPPLARLAMDDQVFVAAFISAHGSIKQMEELFGVSYPTVKNRLNRLAQELGLVRPGPPARGESALDLLERGEIDVEEALGMLGR